MEPEFTSMRANTSKPIFIILQRGLLIQMNHHPTDRKEKTENCLYRYSLQTQIPPPTQHLPTGGKKTPAAIFLVITTVVSYS